ncbi:unnamed protein product [Heligmosomoides polygyrus]|uniref:Uncharacterized protein n=1 Tax=Heligmosomoides polygyrus TaxID=6339 RepID=A0A183GL46_HELPZ|nr:unnamed protein product [Heligmosomoides polygyrus]
MHRLLFLPVFFYQKRNGVYGNDCATASYEAALVARELDDITNALVGNPLEDLHAMRKQLDWTEEKMECPDEQTLMCRLPRNSILSLAITDLRESRKKSLAIVRLKLPDHDPHHRNEWLLQRVPHS